MWLSAAASKIKRPTSPHSAERFPRASINGLAECSRKRHSQAQAVPFAVKEAILELRAQGQTTPGPKKIQTALSEKFPDQPPPSKTTIYNVLKKAGRVDQDQELQAS